MACLILLRKSISFPWLVSSSIAERVHVSQAYRKMDMTRERISLIFELAVMFLSFHKGFNLVSAAVVCAIPCRHNVDAAPRVVNFLSVFLLYTLGSYKIGL